MLKLAAGRSRGYINGQGRVLKSGPLRWAKKPALQESEAHIIQAEEWKQRGWLWTKDTVVVWG